MTTLPTIPDLISRSLKQYQFQFPALLKLSFIYFLVSLLDILLSSSSLVSFINPDLLSQLAMWVTLFFTSWLSVAFILQVNYGKPTLKDKIFSDSLDRTWSLYILIIISLFALFGGALLFLIPGILIFIYLGLSGYFLVLENAGIKESIYKSRLSVKGIEWQIFIRFLIVLIPYFFIYGVLSFIFPILYTHPLLKFLSPLIFALIYPLSSIYTYLIYKEVVVKNNPKEQKVSGKFKFLFGITTIIGGLLFATVFLSTLFNTGV